MTAPAPALRHVLVAIGDSLRPHRWAVLVLAVLSEAFVLGGLGFVYGEDAALAIAVSFMSLAAVAAGTLAGPLVGAAASFAGGAIFFASVAHLGSDQSLLATSVSTAIWMLAAVLSGVIADALREQVVKRHEDSLALAQAQAVGRTAERLLEANSEVARLHATLEASLLPVMPLDHEALEIVTAYRPGEDRLLLGGDFYDVMLLPDGRLALILGDVAGHGPDAAALGARLRAGWQALTLSGASPSAILNSLTKVVTAQPAPELFATVVLAWIDPLARSAALLSAGHPLPLLLSGGVQAIALPPHLPLGLDEVRPPRLTTVPLPPGWTLFFYTDGLIEGRASPASPERYGEQRLMQRLRDDTAGRFDAETLERLLAEVEAANGAAFGDDVAVIAISEKRAQMRRRRTA